jgi:NAD(P)-dependent dehydrogenase (short-subunit alcohol dehydrogenase family)
MSFCPSCGTKNADEARFCEKCGGPLAAAQPQTPASADVQQAAEQVSQAVSSAGRAVGRLNPVLLIGAGIAIVVLLVGYFVFLNPMSESDYEDAADEYVADMFDAQAEITDAFSMYYYSDYPDDELTDTDIADLREAVNEGTAGMKRAAADIRGMRPPKEYKSADKRLNDWAAYLSGGYLDAVGKLLGKMEVGRSYDRVSEDISRFYDDTSKDSERAWRDLSRASGDLGIYLEGD